MKIKKGVNVMIDKNELSILIRDRVISYMPVWVSNDIYTVIEVDNKDKVASLDRNLKNTSNNKIHLNYLIPIKKVRKEKLHNINKLKE